MSKLKRVHNDFDNYVKDICQKMEKITGTKITYTDATKFIADMDSKRIIIMPRKRKKKNILSEIVPFSKC